MISPDTSTLISFFRGESGEDVNMLERSLQDRNTVLIPPVIAEILSDPNLPLKVQQQILTLTKVELKEGFWERAGFLRRKVLSKKLKCRLADAMIAQFCLDHNLTLISRDQDFMSIVQVAGLKCFINH